MIEQQATVIASRGNLVRVSIQRQSGCHSCDAKAGCGTAAIGKWFPSRAENEVDLFIDQFDSAPTRSIVQPKQLKRLLVIRKLVRPYVTNLWPSMLARLIRLYQNA